MTKFESINSKSIDEFAEWLDTYSLFDGSPWMEWFDKTYCQKCEAEYAQLDYLEKECLCAWCEIHKKCKYFPDKDREPNNIEIIKMWLETEAEDEASI